MRAYPPVIGMAYLMAGIAITLLFPQANIDYYPLNYLGIPVIAGGIAMFIWTKKQFENARTTHSPFGKPTALVTSGPFAFTRNPIYLGFTLAILGAGILAGSIPIYLAAVAFLLTINFTFVPHEERMLTEIFGEDYASYKSTVRRWM